MLRLGEAQRAAGESGESEREAPGDADPSGAMGVSRATARVLYRELAQRHHRRVLTAAAALAREHADETAILDDLEARLSEWRAASEADANDLAAGSAG